MEYTEDNKIEYFYVSEGDKETKRTKEQIEEVYDKYHSTVNMTASELENWSNTKCSELASLDRSPIKRNLRLLRKNKSDWDDKDATEANKTVSFVSRMKNAEQGKPVNDECPYSKRDISLRNWAYNPDKKTTKHYVSPSELKLFDNYFVRGYGIIFNTKDLEGDTFSSQTDYGLGRSLIGLPVFYDHTLTGIKSQIGSVVDFSVEDEGILFEIELDRHHKYLEEIQRLIDVKAMGLSTGTMGHTVLSDNGRLKRWLIGEISLTPTPAEFRTIDTMNKQITGEKTLEENTNVQEEQLKENQEVTDVTNAEDTFFKKLNAIADNLGTRIETLETNLTNIKEQFDTAKPVRHTENKGTFLSDVKERENKSFGDFIWNVYAGNTTKLRNKYKAMSEGSGSGGGWTVPQEYVAQLLQAVEDNGVIEKQSTVFTMARNTLNIPSMKHNATYVDGQSNFHAGVHFTSVGEGTDLASNANTQPKFEMITLTANKQAGVTKMSNELDEDSVFSLEGVLIKIFTDALAYRKDWLFLNGSGAGEPLGILNSSAYVSYDLTDSSPTVAELAGMRAQLLPASYDKACWIVNPLLSHLIVGLDNDAVSFSNITGKPSTTLFGLPVFYSTAMPTTVADGGIMLADLNYYLIGQRASLDIAFSAHTDFDTDEVKWRVVWRGDGQPWLRNPIPISSSDEVSPFIVST